MLTGFSIKIIGIMPLLIKKYVLNSTAVLYFCLILLDCFFTVEVFDAKEVLPTLVMKPSKINHDYGRK